MVYFFGLVVYNPPHDSNSSWIVMKPGRELDALVAEKVMGWETRKTPYLSLPGFQNETINARIDTFEKYKFFFLDMNSHAKWTNEEIRERWNREKWVALPYYSTDIAAAWEVVKQLSATCHFKCRNHYYHGTWKVEFVGSRPDGFWSTGDTAPHAICLAALEVVGAHQKGG